MLYIKQLIFLLLSYFRAKLFFVAKGAYKICSDSDCLVKILCGKRSIEIG